MLLHIKYIVHSTTPFYYEYVFIYAPLGVRSGQETRLRRSQGHGLSKGAQG